MKGLNNWHGSGNVSTDVSYGETKSGDKACNFKIAIERSHVPVVFIRINVYAGYVDVCEARNLKKGDYVVIQGELMNRQRIIGDDKITLVEVRCTGLVIEPGRNQGADFGNKNE
jgi:single-stranded DNA-binding protein